MAHRRDRKTRGEKRQAQTAYAKHAGRRDAIRKLLIAGGMVSGAGALPESWTKPVIESIVLPAHAQGTATPPE